MIVKSLILVPYELCKSQGVQVTRLEESLVAEACFVLMGKWLEFVEG
jgi:hypothetical protein